MIRSALTGAAVAAALLATADPAFAFRCPGLIHEISAEIGNRFDLGAHDARKKLAEAARLHAEGKHPEAEMIANQGRKLVGLEKPARPQATR